VTPLVLALAGTDHHPFDRMVQWVDAVAARHTDVRFVVQHGATRPPSTAEGHPFLAHDRLLALLADALVVVCHGGPGTVMDAREAGHVPLCLPRDPRLGEHVDGHQQRFAALVGEAGVVRVVATLDDFHAVLGEALRHGNAGTRAATALSRDREDARARVGIEFDQLISVRPHRLGRRRRAAV
jgi:UDP-N-acetylglucosamine transferase subunit ALG13